MKMNEKYYLKRTANFHPQEVSILIEIIRQYRHIIECKQSDKLLWSKKNQTWEKIAELFNARSCLVYREASVLRKKYENLKKVTKKKYASEKCTVPSPITSIDEEVKALIGITSDGCESACDSDKQNEIQDSSDTTFDASGNNGNESYLPGCYELDAVVEESSSSGADSRLLGELRDSTTESSTEKWNRVAEAKLKLVSLKSRLILKEHDFKTKLMKEEQELARKNCEQKMQQDKEEHMLRVQKLKLELELLKKQIH